MFMEASIDDPHCSAHLVHKLQGQGHQRKEAIIDKGGIDEFALPWPVMVRNSRGTLLSQLAKEGVLPWEGDGRQQALLP